MTVRADREWEQKALLSGKDQSTFTSAPGTLGSSARLPRPHMGRGSHQQPSPSCMAFQDSVELASVRCASLGVSWVTLGDLGAPGDRFPDRLWEK